MPVPPSPPRAALVVGPWALGTFAAAASLPLYRPASTRPAFEAVSESPTLWSAVVGFGLDRVGINRLEARCLDGNAASVRVLEKAGMVHEGTSRSSHLIGGRFRDLHHYAILRDDPRPG